MVIITSLRVPRFCAAQPVTSCKILVLLVCSTTGQSLAAVGITRCILVHDCRSLNFFDRFY